MNSFYASTFGGHLPPFFRGHFNRFFQLNEFVKNGKVTEESDIFEEFDISPDIIETLFRREKDDKGNFYICWGAQKVS